MPRDEAHTKNCLDLMEHCLADRDRIGLPSGVLEGGVARATPRAGFDQKVPVYAGGVDLEFSVDQLLKQAEGFLAKGFRAIKMKVGRKNLAEDVERVAAMRKRLGDGFH